jgi:hypothetical protein
MGVGTKGLYYENQAEQQKEFPGSHAWAVEPFRYRLRTLSIFCMKNH